MNDGGGAGALAKFLVVKQRPVELATRGLRARKRKKTESRALPRGRDTFWVVFCRL